MNCLEGQVRNSKTCHVTIASDGKLGAEGKKMHIAYLKFILSPVNAFFMVQDTKCFLLKALC